MGKIFMYLDETNNTYSELKNEAGNILIFLQNLDQFGAPFGNSWWKGDAANRFFSDMDVCVRELKSFAQALPDFYARIDQEITEWTDVDGSFRYTFEGLPDFSSAIGRHWSDTDGLLDGLEIKFSARDIFGSVLPWTMRYPPDAEVGQFDLFGNTWTQETIFGDWDAGGYAGFTNEGAGLGLYMEGSEWEQTNATTFLGLPFVFSRHGMDYSLKGGFGGEAAASLGGVGVNYAGVSLEVDAGWGWGFDGGSFKFGPLTIGIDPSVYENSEPERPPY